MTPNVLALASSAPVVHVSGGSSIVPGLIGGAVVLVGAFLADLLSRWRGRQILVRFSEAVEEWNTGNAGPPRVGAIMGGQLAGLVFPGESQLLRQLLNSVLRAEGRPAFEERALVGDQDAPKVGGPEEASN